MSDKVSLKDWIDVFSKPMEDLPLAKEIKRWEEINISIVKIDPENTPMGRIEKGIDAINEKLEIEHKIQIEEIESAKRQQVIDRRRFIIGTVIGLLSLAVACVAAVAAVLALSNG